VGSRQFVPTARTDELVVQTLPGETLVYDLRDHTAHCLNDTAAWVWKRCDGQTTVADMASRLGQQLDGPVHEKVVWLALQQLERAHLLHACPPRPPAGPRLSRRSMMRQLGVGAAIAIPAIVSIVAPEAADAASGLPNGSPCQNNNQCSSGCCQHPEGSNSPDKVCTNRASCHFP
jgi:hypothetical protein